MSQGTPKPETLNPKPPPRNESERPRYILVLRFWHPELTEEGWDDISHSLNSLKGGYIGDYIGDHYRGY